MAWNRWYCCEFSRAMYGAPRSGVSPAMPSLIRERLMATVAVNTWRAAALIWPPLASAPPTSVASRAPIGMAYDRLVAPIETSVNEASLLFEEK